MNLHKINPPTGGLTGAEGWALFGVTLACVAVGLYMLLGPIYRDASDEDEEEIWGDYVGDFDTVGDMRDESLRRFATGMAVPGERGTKEQTMTEPECGKVGCRGRWGMGEHTLCTRAVITAPVPVPVPVAEPEQAGVCWCGEDLFHEIHDEVDVRGVLGYHHPNHRYQDIEDYLR